MMATMATVAAYAIAVNGFDNVNAIIAVVIEANPPTIAGTNETVNAEANTPIAAANTNAGVSIFFTSSVN